MFFFCSDLIFGFDLIVAVAAIDRSILTRLERYFGFNPALGANYREHFSRCSVSTAVSTIAITLCFSCPSAVGAPFRLILETTGGVELLLAGGKGEILTAI